MVVTLSVRALDVLARKPAAAWYAAEIDRLPASVDDVPVYVASPKAFKASGCVIEPIVKITLPVGIPVPLAAVTVAVSV